MCTDNMVIVYPMVLIPRGYEQKKKLKNKLRKYRQENNRLKTETPSCYQIKIHI